jgi:hypothetical protein
MHLFGAASVNDGTWNARMFQYLTNIAGVPRGIHDSCLQNNPVCAYHCFLLFDFSVRQSEVLENNWEYCARRDYYKDPTPEESRTQLWFAIEHIEHHLYKAGQAIEGDDAVLNRLREMGRRRWTTYMHDNVLGKIRRHNNVLENLSGLGDLFVPASPRCIPVVSPI